MSVIFTWTVTAICLTGTALNVRKNILCFYLWSIGNIAWLVFDLSGDLYSRAILDAVQLVFALWGIVEWRKKPEQC